MVISEIFSISAVCRLRFEKFFNETMVQIVFACRNTNHWNGSGHHDFEAIFYVGRSRLLEINFSPLAPINQNFLNFDVGPLVHGSFKL